MQQKAKARVQCPWILCEKWKFSIVHATELVRLRQSRMFKMTAKETGFFFKTSKK
jgi:hypothetical protein